MITISAQINVTDKLSEILIYSYINIRKTLNAAWKLIFTYAIKKKTKLHGHKYNIKTS